MLRLVSGWYFYNFQLTLYLAHKNVLKHRYERVKRRSSRRRSSLAVSGPFGAYTRRRYWTVWRMCAHKAGVMTARSVRRCPLGWVAGRRCLGRLRKLHGSGGMPDRGFNVVDLGVDGHALSSTMMCNASSTRARVRGFAPASVFSRIYTVRAVAVAQRASKN